VLTTYTTDGSQTVFTFDWPYLDRTHVFVMVNEAARPFSWVDDHTLKITTTYGDPFETGLTLKIYRVTPDLVSFAEFQDNSNLTANDLNRARLQVLFLIQERSGGIAGYVGQAIQSVTNDLQSISGALADLDYARGVIEAGLQTLSDLQATITRVDNSAKSLQDQIDAEIKERTDAGATLTQQVNKLSSTVDARITSFQSQVQLLQSSTDILANKQDTLEAKVDSIDLTPDDSTDDDANDIAASIIMTAVAGVKLDFAQKAQIESYAQDVSAVQAQVEQNWIDAQALVQTEREARVTADTDIAGQITSLTEQITTLQATVGDNIAQAVEDIKTQIDTIDGQVTNLSAQYTLKAMVQRSDGKYVMAGISLAATSNTDYTGSEIIMAADKLLFVDSNAPNGTLKPIFETGVVDGANTFVIPANVVGDETIPGRVLVDGTIEARALAADSVTADKIVAGAITTDKLAVGIGTNLLPYSEFPNVYAGTTQAQGWYMAQASGVTDTAMGYDLASWALGGGHTIFLTNTTVYGVSNMDGSKWAQYYSDAIPVIAGTRYEFSAYVGAHRCLVDIAVIWYDANGAGISSAGYYPAAGCYCLPNAAMGGVALSGYLRIGGFGTAPVNAATARIIIRKTMHQSPDTSSYLFMTHPMLAESTSSASVLSPYSPGGRGTTITADGISTPSLSALSANIGLLRTSTSGARLEIDSSQIRVFDANNVQRLLLGIW
jgi:hypothetical protein